MYISPLTVPVPVAELDGPGEAVFSPAGLNVYDPKLVAVS